MVYVRSTTVCTPSVVLGYCRCRLLDEFLPRSELLLRIAKCQRNNEEPKAHRDDASYLSFLRAMLLGLRWLMETSDEPIDRADRYSRDESRIHQISNEKGEAVTLGMFDFRWQLLSLPMYGLDSHDALPVRDAVALSASPTLPRSGINSPYEVVNESFSLWYPWTRHARTVPWTMPTALPCL